MAKEIQIWSLAFTSYLNNRLGLFIANVLDRVKSWSLCIALGIGESTSRIEKLSTLTIALWAGK